jgi:uncharacterized Zn-binding protein involved in type VI secretion
MKPLGELFSLIVNKYLWKCGRTVLSGSVVAKFSSIRVAREGGAVLCPISGYNRTVIAEGTSDV